METQTPGRQTILPPPPSRARMFLAFVTALWCLVVASLQKRMDGLVRHARRGRGVLVARSAPSLPSSPDPPLPALCEQGVLAFLATQRLGATAPSMSATAVSRRR